VAHPAAGLRSDAGVRLRGCSDAVPLQGRHAGQRELARGRLRRAPHSRRREPAPRDRDRELAPGCTHRLAVAGAPVAQLNASRNERGLTLTELAVVMILGTMIMAGLVGFYLSSQGLWLDASTQAITQREASLVATAVRDSLRKSGKAV